MMEMLIFIFFNFGEFNWFIYWFFVASIFFFLICSIRMFILLRRIYLRPCGSYLITWCEYACINEVIEIYLIVMNSTNFKFTENDSNHTHTAYHIYMVSIKEGAEVETIVKIDYVKWIPSLLFAMYALASTYTYRRINFYQCRFRIVRSFATDKLFVVYSK